MQSVASQVQRDKTIAEQAKAGAGGLSRILDADTIKFRFPSLLRREATVANKALEELESKLDVATMDRLVAGMKSGQSANKLLDMMPTAKQKNMLNEIITAGGYRPAIVTGMVEAEK
jgi:hypothetical protein